MAGFRAQSHQLLALPAIFALCLLAAHAEAGSWPRETVHNESFDVGAGGSLTIDVPDADLELRVGSGNSVELEIEIASRDLEEARDRFEKMNFEASVRGDSINLTAQRIRSWSFTGWSGMQVIARITLPEQFDLDLRTGDGDIAVESVAGALRVKSSDGDIAIGRVGTTEAVVESSDGNISIGELSCTSARIGTSDGDIQLARVDGDRVEVRSGDGDIAIRNASGGLSVRTSDGDISVAIDQPGETELHSGDGDITIRLAKHVGAELELSGDDVGLSGSTEFDGTRSTRRVSGAINGGGPLLTASSRDGSVVLRTR